VPNGVDAWDVCGGLQAETTMRGACNDHFTFVFYRLLSRPMPYLLASSMKSPSPIPHPNRSSLAIASGMLLFSGVGFAADHLDSPSVGGSPSLDINDLYLFESPTNPNRSVFIMTVNPFLGMTPGGTFASDIGSSFQFQIDNDGDAVADVTYETTFSPSAAGTQAYSVTRNLAPIAAGTTGGGTSTFGTGQVQVGDFDDPFFFDLTGFQNTLAGTGTFTGEDTFAGANISAIVFEVDTADFIGAGNNVGAQARTLFGAVQFDRIGRPAINTVLINSADKDAFNVGDPANDFATFGMQVEANINALGGDGAALTPVLLPDLLTYDVTNPSGYLNGRRLDDDVIDASLNLLTGGGITTDLVNANDNAFLNVFPYLAAPNIPEPSRALLLTLGLTGLIVRRRR